jgi:membrane-associated phospholipid phosphatase
MQVKPHYFNTNLLFNFVRSSELVMVFIHLINALIYKSQTSLILSVIIILSSYVNYIFKHDISKPIFEMFGNYIPILGRGPRPEGASDCGYFSNCPKVEAKSFGFPSGHSQFAGIHAGFLIRDIIKRKSTNNTFSGLNKSDKLSVLFLLLTIPVMMYSRVYVEGCHTIEQTIFGSIIGYSMGYFSYDIYDKYKNNINSILNLNSNLNRILIFIVCIFLFFI